TFTKPPIHGWTLMRMLDRGMLDDDGLREAYGPLSAWTEWWLSSRVAPGGRLPHYFHGNDSGWDNSTVFAAGVPLESPDLAAFLVLQAEALSRVATALGDADGERRWSLVASGLLEALLEDLWDGERFTARIATTGEEVP